MSRHTQLYPGLYILRFLVNFATTKPKYLLQYFFMYKTAILILLIHLFNTIHTEAFHDENDTVPPSAHLLSRYIRHASVTGNERMAGLFFSTVARQKGFRKPPGICSVSWEE